MLILFDHVTPKGISRALVGHRVTRAKDRGWDTPSNGNLLAAAESAGFDVVNSQRRDRRHSRQLHGSEI
jgi:hypothetical protein